MTDCPACGRDHERGSVECPGRRCGTVFNNKYELLSVLGCGGMGAVYKARHIGLERMVALKLILTGMVGTEDRFRDEARRVAKLRHTGIAEIFDHGCDPSGVAYIEMELLDGQSVEAWAASARGVEECVDVVRRALEPLAFAHAAGVVHRDIKPDNLFLLKDRSRVVLLDFGIARGVSSEAKTAAGARFGTLLYMSPEQFEDASKVDTRTDVFSMAATLYRLLVGRPPLGGGTVTDLVKGLVNREIPRSVIAAGTSLPPYLETAIAAALDPDPNGRPRDAAAFLESLRPKALAPTQKSEPPAHAATPASMAGPRSRAPLFVVVGLITVLGVGAAILAATSSNKTTVPPAHSDAAVDAHGRIDGSVPDAAPPPADMVRVAGAAFKTGLADVGTFTAWCKSVERDYAFCDELVRRAAAVQRSADVPSFEIDVTEVPVARFAAWLNDELANKRAVIKRDRIIRPTGELLADPACDRVSGMRLEGGIVRTITPLDRAAVCMTFVAARAYCDANGKRLPSLAEWQLASAGPEHRLFPWGDAMPKCTDVIYGRDEAGACPKSVEGPQPVNDGALDSTPLGVHGMGGNVSEWVEEPGTPVDAPEHLTAGGNWSGGLVDLTPAKVWLLGATADNDFPGRTTVGFRCAMTIK